MATQDTYEVALNAWVNNEKAALELLQITSKLQLERDIELVLFRRKLFDKSISTNRDGYVALNGMF